MAPVVRREEALALLALGCAPRRGPATIRGLVDEHGSGRAALAAVGGAGPRELESARAVLARAAAKGLGVLAYGQPGYPEGLGDLAHPPPLLFLDGVPRFDRDRTVAIVGTRAASAYGRRVARRLAAELAGWGWIVVSGMARGIDGEAHAGALDAGGHSIGVLGSGHEHEYPPENRALYARMRADGLLLSEFAPDAPPRRSSFPRRNRLIAALARAVIVVEAGPKSGALNTVTHALDLGREALAVPGRIEDVGGQGTAAMLRDGAGIVTCGRDVLDALGWLESTVPAPAEAAGGDERGRRRGAGPEADRDIIALLADRGLSVDEIAARTRTSVAEALARLGRLEIGGWVVRGADGAFRALSGPVVR